MDPLADALADGRPMLVGHAEGGMMSWDPTYNDMYPVDPLIRAIDATSTKPETDTTTEVVTEEDQRDGKTIDAR
jgi:hypothetical protein